MSIAQGTTRLVEEQCCAQEKIETIKINIIYSYIKICIFLIPFFPTLIDSVVFNFINQLVDQLEKLGFLRSS